MVFLRMKVFKREINKVYLSRVFGNYEIIFWRDKKYEVVFLLNY